MPTNRPFFGSFLSAFRAHSSIQKATSSSSVAGPSQSSYTTQTSSSSSIPIPNTTNTATPSSQNRTITKTGQTLSTGGGGATTVAIQAAGQFQPTRQHSASPYSRSPGSPSAAGAFTPIQSRGRRGSDSSSEGFKDAAVPGAEKWYIGGRTAGGEERFYKLSMVKRPKSIDRLSLDRMSL